jgi:hypothetical protein
MKSEEMSMEEDSFDDNEAISPIEKEVGNEGAIS